MCSVEGNVIRRAYRYELRPTAKQRTLLERSAHARRFIYNWGLSRWRTHYAEHGKSIRIRQLSREVTALKRKPGFEWLTEIDSQALQQPLFDLRQAYENFFARRARYPRFKSRKRDPLRFRIPQRVRVRDDSIYVPKIGWVRARVSRPVIGKLKSATFKRDAAGKWFVSLVAEVGSAPVPTESAGPRRVVGIDVGLKDLVVLSDGTRVRAPRFLAQSERKLKRAHRRLSRTQPGSRNRTRARLRLARIYRRAADRRRDFLHKLTTAVVRGYDAICVEDLGVSGLARTKLARALHDCALRELRRQLEYKSVWSGKPFVAVDRFFPSSKLCSHCGAINAELRPRERSWTCECGAIHDRDLNAARNIRAAAIAQLVAVGHTDTENACGDRVRLPMGAAVDESGIQGALAPRERQHAGALPSEEGGAS